MPNEINGAYSSVNGASIQLFGTTVEVLHFLLGSSKKIPVMILWDTGAAQSLILESVLPFSVDSANGDEVMIQGVELGHLSLPLQHNTEL